MTRRMMESLQKNQSHRGHIFYIREDWLHKEQHTTKVTLLLLLLLLYNKVRTGIPKPPPPPCLKGWGEAGDLCVQMAFDGFSNLGKSSFDDDKKVAVLKTLFFVRELERVLVEVRIHIRRRIGPDCSRVMYSFMERCPSAKVQETQLTK